jgi:hypothetical protein
MVSMAGKGPFSREPRINAPYRTGLSHFDYSRASERPGEGMRHWDDVDAFSCYREVNNKLATGLKNRRQ